ncbi:hypothetical protein BJX99DRAFT_222391 [Aspergillus californicus]
MGQPCGPCQSELVWSTISRSLILSLFGRLCFAVTCIWCIGRTMSFISFIYTRLPI